MIVFDKKGYFEIVHKNTSWVMGNQEYNQLKDIHIREFLEKNTVTEILMLKSTYDYIKDKKKDLEEGK